MRSWRRHTSQQHVVRKLLGWLRLAALNDIIHNNLNNSSSSCHAQYKFGMQSSDWLSRFDKIVKQKQQQQWIQYIPDAPMMWSKTNVTVRASWLIWRLGDVIPANNLQLEIVGLCEALAAVKWQHPQQYKQEQSQQQQQQQLMSCAIQIWHAIEWKVIEIW